MPKKFWFMYLVGLAVTLAFIGVGYYALSRVMEYQQFAWVPNPPVPQAAQKVLTMYPSMGGQRIVEYETTQSVADVRSFYDQKIKGNGWRYLCSPTGEADDACPYSLNPGAVESAAYVQDDPVNLHSIQVTIYPTSPASDTRKVIINENLWEKTAKRSTR